MIRKFRVINSEGAAYDLNSKQSFFHKVDGFGYKEETDFQRIGPIFMLWRKSSRRERSQGASSSADREHMSNTVISQSLSG